MNRITPPTFFRFFVVLLLCIVLSTPVDAGAERGVSGVMVADGEYKVKLDGDAFGDEKTAWSFSLQFSKFGVIGRFIVISNENIPIREHNRIVITFNTLPPVETLTIPCESADGIGFNFALSSGILRPMRIDYMTTPFNEIEAQNMAVLIAYNIKSIKINDVLLPGPYPTTQEFLKLFDEGVSKFPGCSYYDKYHADRSGKSRTNSQKNSGKSVSQTQKSQPTSPKLKRPDAIPENIPIVEGKDLGERCIYKNYNCTLFKKSGSSLIDFKSPTFAELLAHPLGIKDLTWTANEALLFQEADKTGYPLMGYYHYKDKYDYVTTIIEFPGIMYLPGEFEYNSSRIRFRANNFFPSVRVATNNGKTTMQTSISYHVFFDKYPLKDSYSKKEIKKFNKELLKFYLNMIENLRKQGYDFRKDNYAKLNDNRYSLSLPDGKECSFTLQLWPSGNITSEYISLHILDTKPSK